MKLRESTEQLADEPMEQMAESPTRHVGHPGSHRDSGLGDRASDGKSGPSVDGAIALT